MGLRLHCSCPLVLFPLTITPKFSEADQYPLPSSLSWDSGVASWALQLSLLPGDFLFFCCIFFSKIDPQIALAFGIFCFNFWHCILFLPGDLLITDGNWSNDDTLAKTIHRLTIVYRAFYVQTRLVVIKDNEYQVSYCFMCQWKTAPFTENFYLKYLTWQIVQKFCGYVC